MIKLNFLILTAAFLGLSLTTMASEEIVCLSMTVSPIHHVRFSDLMSRQPKVELVLRSSNNRGSKILKGTCKPDDQAIEMALNCNISTSTDSGYRLYLYSKGGASLGASVAKWSMLGEGPIQSLNCSAL